MKSYNVIENKNFVGRAHELQQLQALDNAKRATIVVVYGRRRVGKTELLEQAFKDRNILKFEGLENRPKQTQINFALEQLSEYLGSLWVSKLKLTNWREFFKLVAEHIQEGKWTLYFEEMQWLADYDDEFVGDLKYAWDNYLRCNNELIVVLCGSSPSFIINKVLHSKALYNRSQYEIQLEEFKLPEIESFLPNKSKQEILDAYLTVGGIPEYLQRLKTNSSVFLSLCQETFVANGFFSKEYKRIFTSSFASNKHYQQIVEFLARQRFATRKQIASYLGVSPGGTLSLILEDLEVCGFIQRYTPYHLSEKSSLSRYCITDCYLQFYFKFVKPITKNIDEGQFNKTPTKAIQLANYHQWLGYSFERFCRKHHWIIAKILGFSGMHYKHGAYFNKRTQESEPSYQIDLLFDRADRVYTICEIKYSQKKINTAIIDEFEREVTRFQNPKNHTIHRVLIAPNGVEQSLIDRGYFDNIITFDELFAPHYW